jgi:nucleotide-binding universal stress UspA family protein
MYSAVLVPLDGSQSAAAAIPPALELAEAFVTRLVLLRVLPSRDGAAEPPQRDYDAQRFQAEGYLEGLKRSLRTRGVRIESVVTSGDPASVILGTATSLGHSLVVITSHGMTRPQAEKKLGGVALDVLQRSDLPVVLVHSGHDLDDPSPNGQVNR